MKNWNSNWATLTPIILAKQCLTQFPRRWHNLFYPWCLSSLQRTRHKHSIYMPVIATTSVGKSTSECSVIQTDHLRWDSCEGRFLIFHVAKLIILIIGLLILRGLSTFSKSCYSKQLSAAQINFSRQKFINSEPKTSWSASVWYSITFPCIGMSCVTTIYSFIWCARINIRKWASEWWFVFGIHRI